MPQTGSKRTVDDPSASFAAWYHWMTIRLSPDSLHNYLHNYLMTSLGLF